MTRKQFIESEGASCENWQYSWSFVDHRRRRVIFGEWQNRGGKRLFSLDWEAKKATGRKNPGFKQSREHIRLVEDEGYRLFVFPLYAQDPLATRAVIKYFEPTLFERGLRCENGRNWYATGEPLPARKPKTWILQGNPAFFEIDDYLDEGGLVYWRIPTHRNDIFLGDRVYIWRAGGVSGIVAAGTVRELPAEEGAVKHPELLGDEFWKTGSQAEVERKKGYPQVGIELDQVRLDEREGMICRGELLSDEVLSKSSIIRCSRATVFPLDGEEAERLNGLWTVPKGRRWDPHSISAIEGGKKEVSLLVRKRDRGLARKKMRKAMALGAVSCEVCGLTEDERYPIGFSLKVFEVHHLRPLGRTCGTTETTLDDLAVVCANCHRAIHSTDDVEKNFNILKRNFGKDPGS